MNSSTCNVHTHFEMRVSMYMDKLESIGPLTCYVSPGYGAHGVMEGHEQTWMGTKQWFLSCTYTTMR